MGPRRTCEHLDSYRVRCDAAGCSLLSHLIISTLKAGPASLSALFALPDAIKANRGIKALEVGEFLSSDEWECLWEVAASHPTVRVGHGSVNGVHLRSDDPAGFDRLHAVERAVRSNGRLKSIKVMDEQFYDGTTRPTRYSARFKNRRRGSRSLVRDAVRGPCDGHFIEQVLD